MSYIYVGVGGSGAKLMQSLVHLTAAGLMPAGGRELKGFLVDPDESNGNVKETLTVCGLYSRCKEIKVGDGATLFQNKLTVRGPWTPVDDDDDTATLESIFHYDPAKRGDALETDLMDIFFGAEDRTLSIKQGFRGRPAIGSAVLAEKIDFTAPFWSELHSAALNARAQEKVGLVLGGSVFGGSGAAGVPTICRLLKEELNQHIGDKQLSLALTLFLPYFTYDKVKRPENQEAEVLQADPFTFATATAEALKYYDDGEFLDICDALYCVGERYPAHMPKSAVGAAEQQNPAHFLELVAALGAIRFWSGEGNRTEKGAVDLACRTLDEKVMWRDLPTAKALRGEQLARLQQFILFCVVYHYQLCPFTLANLHERHVITGHLDDVHGDYGGRAQAGVDLQALDAYVMSFLHWLLSISTFRRAGASDIVPGLVDVRVFATTDSARGWRVKTLEEFKKKQVEELFLNLETKRKPDLRSIWRAVGQAEKQVQATGAGRHIQAVYDACKF